MRASMFVLTLVFGLALSVAGWFLAAPIGPTASPVFSNPRMPFATLMFIVGIMVVFISVVVYELYPGGEG